MEGGKEGGRGKEGEGGMEESFKKAHCTCACSRVVILCFQDPPSCFIIKRDMNSSPLRGTHARVPNTSRYNFFCSRSYVLHVWLATDSC